MASSARSTTRPCLASALAGWLSVVACTGGIGQHAGDAPASGTSSQPGNGSPAPTGSGAPGDTGGGFPGASPAPATAQPITGQRLTDRQYLNIVSDLLQVDASAEVAALPLDSKLDGFRNAGAVLLPSDLRIEGYADAAAAVVGKVNWAARLSQDAVCTDFNDKCQGDFLASTGRRLFRRPLTADESQRFGLVFAAVKKEGDPFAVATALVTRAMLQSPEFLYRLEKTGTVDDYAVATRLSFLLWNTTPDDALLDAAAQSQLGAASALGAQVKRMLDDPRAQRALRDYVDDWLDADKLPRTSRDATLFPLFTPELAADMREEVHRLFARIAFTEDGDLLDVFRSDKTTITPALAKLYGVPAPTAAGFSDVSLAGNPNRQGLLTSAGVLTVTSVGSAGSSIVDRGVFVLRGLLCTNVPEPPLNVPELPPPTPGLSERARMAQHRADPACGACHNLIDPLGVAFETYDGIGAFQSKDAQGNALTGAGTITVSGKTIDYKNAREFITALTSDPALESCLVRKVAQYTFARPLTGADDPAIAALSAGFAQSGRRYRSLLTAVAQGSWIRQPGVSP